MSNLFKHLGQLAATLASACTVEVMNVDPTVDYQDEGGYVLEGEPRLELGYYSEQLYTRVGDGDPCTIVPNPQGGFWSSPTIRAGGILAEVRARCTLRTGDGELISETRERRHMVLSPNGMVEMTNVPMSVQRQDPEGDVEDLYGEMATLECTLKDDEDRVASLAVRCVLEPGTG